jgi:two-component system chemotaxis response regulator CheB
MFEAIAQVYGSKSLGLLLTGMGRDGAAGLLSIHQVGGITAAQDEASSVIFGMPKEAIAQGAVQHILSLESIPAFLIDAVK